MPSGSWIHISVKPQGSVADPRMMGTSAAASRARADASAQVVAAVLRGHAASGGCQVRRTVRIDLACGQSAGAAVGVR
jgi:hypothetical protein